MHITPKKLSIIQATSIFEAFSPKKDTPIDKVNKGVVFINTETVESLKYLVTVLAVVMLATPASNLIINTFLFSFGTLDEITYSLGPKYRNRDIQAMTDIRKTH